MNKSYWLQELNRLFLIIVVGLGVGAITELWLIALVLVLIGYICWNIHKRNQILRWLRHDTNNDYYPDSDGIWGQLVDQIEALQRRSNKRKKRMSTLIKRFQGIVKGLPYATVVLNGDNEIDWANELSLNYLNINLQKDRGQRIDNIIRQSQLSAILNKHAPRKAVISLPHFSSRQLLVQVVPVQSDLKLIIAQDISDYVNVQTMRRNFISNASHELRTPLTVITGYLEMMQEDEKITEGQQVIINTAKQQADRMGAIIEEMLTLSKLERSQLEESKCTIINVPSILNMIGLDEVGRLHKETHKIQLDVDENLYLNGSESEVTSVCSNLIYNAVKHTAPGTKVSISWSQSDNGDAVLSVIDDGEGIPVEHLPRLTERFYRVDQNRSRDMGGTGLGLAIALHIMQRHGGELKINSSVGNGSEFSAVFPAMRVVVGDM